jgi:hypothetical protein
MDLVPDETAASGNAGPAIIARSGPGTSAAGRPGSRSPTTVAGR